MDDLDALLEDLGRPKSVSVVPPPANNAARKPRAPSSKVDLNELEDLMQDLAAPSTLPPPSAKPPVAKATPAGGIGVRTSFASGGTLGSNTAVKPPAPTAKPAYAPPPPSSSLSAPDTDDLDALMASLNSAPSRESTRPPSVKATPPPPAPVPSYEAYAESYATPPPPLPSRNTPPPSQVATPSPTPPPPPPPPASTTTMDDLDELLSNLEPVKPARPSSTYNPPPASYSPTPSYPPAPAYTPHAPVYAPPTPAYTPPAPAYTPPTPAYTPPTPAYTPAPTYTPPSAYAPPPAVPSPAYASGNGARPVAPAPALAARPPQPAYGGGVGVAVGGGGVGGGIGAKPAGPAKPVGGDDLDSLLKNLTTQMKDIDKSGPASRGTCKHCKNPILGEVIQAMGAAYHPEHFVCGNCQNPLGTNNFYEQDGLPHCERCYQELFCARCAHCDEPILDRCVTALNKKWHVNHFICTQCLGPFEGGTFFEKEGRPYCESCYYAAFASRCGSCNQPIRGECINALGQQWHPEHFVCQYCQKSFGGGAFYEHGGKPYCETHYHQQTGSLCAGCGKAITGRCVNALDKKWHPEHFVCAFCMNPLAGGSFTEAGGKAYCKDCHGKLFG